MNSYYAYQSGTKLSEINHKCSNAYTTAKTNERSEIILYRGPKKEIFRQGEIALKVKEISLNIVKL